MKCCASQTISIAPERDADAARAREVAVQFDAMLASAALQPLAAAMGFYGDVVVGAASEAMARSERGGLADRLQRAIEDAARSKSERAR